MAGNAFNAGAMAVALMGMVFAFPWGQSTIDIDDQEAGDRAQSEGSESENLMLSSEESLPGEGGED